jgi:hypothetical protein
MGFWTNRGSYRALGIIGRAEAAPTQFNYMYFTDAVTPTVDTNTVSELIEIPAGNGYTSGGIPVARNATDFDTWTEDDGNNRALLQLKNLVSTASGGNLPASGSGARWGALVDNNGTIASREVWFVFDLVSNRIVSDGQPLTMQDLEIRINN